MQVFPVDRDDCVRNYLNTDAFQGFKLVWLSYFHLAIDERVDSYKQDLIELQRAGSCCGFGPPLRCEVSKELWPSNLPLDSTSTSNEWAYSGKRQECGIEKGWYKATYGCNRPVDPSIYPPVFGGCPYEYPLGECSAEFPTDASHVGCAETLEMTMKGAVSDTATIVLIMTTIPMLAGICSCCLFFKRKDWDVLPETYPGLIKRKEAPVDAIDEDGFLLLSVAETAHEYIKAFNMCIRDAEQAQRTSSERIWKMEDLLKVAHEKQNSESGWPAEVDAAYKRCLKVVDQIDTDTAQTNLVNVAND